MKDQVKRYCVPFSPSPLQRLRHDCQLHVSPGRALTLEKLGHLPANDCIVSDIPVGSYHQHPQDGRHDAVCVWSSTLGRTSWELW